MIELDPTIAGRAVRSPIEPGNHGAISERYRMEALAQMKLLQIYAAEMEEALRSEPDKDPQLDVWCNVFWDTMQETAAKISGFRETRDCRGEA